MKKKMDYDKYGSKAIRDNKKERAFYASKTTKVAMKDRPKRKRSTDEDSDIVKKYNVTWHAVSRYAERVFEIEPTELTQEQIYGLAKIIRDSLPRVIVDTKYKIDDHNFAVVNGGVVVTILKV